MFKSQNPNSEASKQAYLRDAANYMFDTYGESALDRLTQDFDACMKEFHEHRLEVLRKLQTPEGVAMIREMTYAKIKEQQMEGYEAETKALLPSTEDEVVAKEREIAEEYLARLKAERTRNAALVAELEKIKEEHGYRYTYGDGFGNVVEKRINSVGVAVDKALTANTEKGGAND